MRRINEIIIHCADTPEGRDNTVKDITAWHKQKGYRTIGYHYVIYRDGSVHAGRPESEVGAHCKEHNAHSIGICYIGGRSSDLKEVKDTRTPEQKEALLTLLKELKAKYPNATIHGHREFTCKQKTLGKCPGCAERNDADTCKFPAKPCPSFNASREYRQLTNEASAEGAGSLCLARRKKSDAQLAIAILLIFLGILFSGCRTSKRSLEEKADSTVLQTVSQSATSSSTDMFLQNMVLQIDSIVFTQLYVPQVPQSDDAGIGRSCDISSTSGDKAPRSKGKANKKGDAHQSNASCSSSVPLNASTKVLISGIRLESTTSDSSVVTTSKSDSITRQASHSTLVKAKESKKPPNRICLWLILIIIAAIAIAVVIAMSKTNSPVRTFLRFVFRKVMS